MINASKPQGDMHVLGHGMGTCLEPKDWPHITLNELNQLKAHYAVLHGQLEIVWRSPRPFSSAVIVHVTPEHADAHTKNTAQFFIKRSHGSFRNVDDLLQEHVFIQHLADQQICVPKLITHTENSTALAMGDWSYEIFERAQGFDLYADQLSWKPFFNACHAAKAGQMLARMHRAAQGFSIRNERSAKYLVSNQKLLESEDLVSAIRQRIEQSSALKAYFQQHVLDENFLTQAHVIHQKIKKTFQKQQKIWTHNDLHASNLLWSENSSNAEISSVIDFGLCDYNSALYDLAVTIERNFIDWLELKKSDQGAYNTIYIDQKGLQAFMDGYLKLIPEVEHLHILPELIKIVHLDFAFSELEYFIDITHNLNHANAAYYDWLISHTDWFCQTQGQAFSQFLSKLLPVRQVELIE
ncbi:phosphotransferase enzyme family protein [Acinetobacter shaoyimingii]|uniref:phosphotransferase enzyme family protein n=1 Tax=Acinetobacter shaoyimingii TaxID=2715164 RepID=UPI001D0F1350|nr:phosphotransferase [Acinetobacter shaoyimingii]